MPANELGIVPPKEAYGIRNVANFDIVPISGGIDPMKQLLDISRYVKELIWASAEGICPVNLLYDSCMCETAVNPPIVDGKVPAILLEYK
jgi:hypothetical protein